MIRSATGITLINVNTDSFRKLIVSSATNSELRNRNYVVPQVTAPIKTQAIKESVKNGIIQLEAGIKIILPRN